MRVPVSWLRELVDLPDDQDGRAIAERLVQAGLEVETVERTGAVEGPLLVGRVVGLDEETASNGKTIRWCQVDTGDQVRGIVCGAGNFAIEDRVVVAIPGTTLPGGFHITARKTYGHVSDGMICSVLELGIGDDHDGILVLEGEPAPGTDAAALLGLGDEVLDIAVTPDRGYCLSMRGIAREAATAYGVPWRDPAALADPTMDAPGWPVRVDDPTGCDVFVARVVAGLDPTRTSPGWLQQRLTSSGMRSISLIVDVTNYVMLELGQPIHGYDLDRLHGAIVVRRATAGESLQTLDGTVRELDAEDLVIADDSGAIGVAGVMGGASTEVSGTTTALVVEAAHFDPVAVTRAARRHRLPSEASRRFERGVDPRLPTVAAQRVVSLLVELGGGTAEPGATVVDTRADGPAIVFDPGYTNRRSGLSLEDGEVRDRLHSVGCVVGADWAVTAPSWRPDLTDPADLVEEVVRLVGYHRVPSVLPRAVPGRGLTAVQRRRRAVGRALAGVGCVEVLNYPFIAPADLDLLGIDSADRRRRLLNLTNPMSAEAPALRSTLLPGLLTTAVRNLGRGHADVALFEIGTVVVARTDAIPAPRPPVDRRPTESELSALAASLPEQSTHVGAVLIGERARSGWWGSGRSSDWMDAVDVAHAVAAASGVELTVAAAECAPWHPGRCVELRVVDVVVGHAGELHPRVAEDFRLPPGTAALELDLDAMPLPAAAVTAPAISSYPAAAQDVALVVAAAVPAADVERALRAGAGPLLESIRLFDVYEGEQLEAGHKSLAFALRFRAADRTLTAEEVAVLRDAALAEATRRTEAVLRT